MIYNKDIRIIRFKDSTEFIEDTSLDSLSVKTQEIYRVREDDTLLSISTQFFQTTTNWYRIANHNDLVDPFELTIGQLLNIPDIEN